MKKIIPFLLVIFLIPAKSNAQEKVIWTLEECVEQALDENISLKRQALSTELNKKDFNQSKLNALPDLNGQVRHELGSGRILDRGTYEWLNTDVNQGDLGMISNFTLFKGLQGYNNMKMSEANYLASIARLESNENELVLQVMTAYLEMLRNSELLEIAKEKVKLTVMQVERMKQLVELGNAAPGELLEVKAQASRENYNQTIARNNLEIAKLKLLHLLNLDTAQPFDIERPDLPVPNILQITDLDEVYLNALEFLPQVREADHNITSSQKELAVARGQLSPELFVRALYWSNYSDKLINPREIDPFNPVLDYPVPLQVADNQYKQVSIGLNIPILNKWQARTSISKAKIGLQDARYNMEDTQQQLLQTIQIYHTDARAALDNYKAAMESVANSDEAYRYAEEKYKVGMATALELEEARNQKFESQVEMITSKYVFVFYNKILDFYQGKDISLSS